MTTQRERGKVRTMRRSETNMRKVSMHPPNPLLSSAILTEAGLWDIVVLGGKLPPPLKCPEDSMSISSEFQNCISLHFH